MYFSRVSTRYILTCFLLSEAASLFNITPGDIEEAVRNAENIVNINHAKGSYLDPTIISAEARSQLQQCGRGSRSINSQSILESATKELVKRYGVNRNEVRELVNVQLEGILSRQIRDDCVDNRTANCTNTRYRNVDGSCSNLAQTNEGRTFTCLQRLLPSDCADGVSEPRTGRNGPLPGARVVSLAITAIGNRRDNLSRYATVMHMSFGQFVDHDLELTAQPSINGAPISCCPDNPDNNVNCFPIPIPPNDPVFTGRNCMNFVRDQPCTHCQLGPREQMNTLTSVIDASQVYGTTEEQASNLRTNSGDGKLRSCVVDGIGELPPPSENQDTDQCSTEQFSAFLLGDTRANQNLILMLLEISYLRFHNYICTELKKLNPAWDDETLYQECRRIVIACHENIIYWEYLPVVIGDRLMQEFNIYDDHTRHESDEDLSLWNSFAAAFFRLHSTVPECFLALDEDWNAVNCPLLADTYFSTRLVYEGQAENLIRGASRQAEDKFDRFLSMSVGAFLYRVNTTGTTFDLGSINIQRGRDHCLPGYKYFVERIHSYTINSIDDLYRYGLISVECRGLLEDIYNNTVEDIDLYPGLLCEPVLNGTTVGPTTAYVLAKQFRKLKYGDRFFYTHRGQTSSFTDDQYTEIRKMKLSSILCTTFELNDIPLLVLDKRSEITPCSDIYQINLSPWKE